MKTRLILLVLSWAALSVSAQTKGTTTLGLGVNVFERIYIGGSSENKLRINSFNYGIGHFFADYSRISVDFNSGKETFNRGNRFLVAMTKTIGGQVNYQKYYHLSKSLHAYAGGSGEYRENNREFDNTTSSTKSYSLGAIGGLTWFIAKRFAIETKVLSAKAMYAKGTTQQNDGTERNSASDFDLQMGGSVTNLNLKIYLLL